MHVLISRSHTDVTTHDVMCAAVTPPAPPSIEQCEGRGMVVINVCIDDQASARKYDDGSAVV